MNNAKNATALSFAKSLKFRLLVMVIMTMITISMVFTFYVVNQFQSLSILNIEHEGMLLSDTIQSGIKEYAIKSDIKRIQAYTQSV